MRIAGLLVLTILLPLTVYAALININTADATLLDTLPGIGPSKAAAIVDYRTKNGPFATIEDIQKVSGIGPVTFANLKDKITVGASAGGGPASGGQPSVPATSYTKVQAVKPASPIINQETNIQQNEKAVIAPTTTVEPAVVGAVAKSRASGLFSSIWTLGLLGVIVVAGGIFIFL